MDTKLKDGEEIAEPKNAQRVLAIVHGTTLSKNLDIEVGEDEALVFPHLIYIELLASLLSIIFLWIVSLLINAPLEELANPTFSPNPAKAPWYFLGLQELLVYFDPWIAGVMIPFLMIIGLMAIPYLDPGKEAVGVYNFFKRKFAVTIFTVGIMTWFVLIIIGVYFRGPSWAWYLPWEDWLIHKEFVPAKNLPIFLGSFLILFYFLAGLTVPRLLFKKFYSDLGAARYFISIFFILLMFGVLVKIALRLLFNIKYILTTPWFNI
jgi:hypothetical protein